MKNFFMNSKVLFATAATYFRHKIKLGHAWSCLCWVLFAALMVFLLQNFTVLLYYTSKSLFVSQYISPVNKYKMSPLNEAISVHNNISEDDWRRVTDNIYVYSAFLDTRRNNEIFVRIIAGVRIHDAKLKEVKCILNYNFSTVVEVAAKHEILSEHHNHASRSVYFYCNVFSIAVPDYATIVPTNYNQTRISSWLTVHLLKNNSTSSNIGVCVRPIYNYTDVFAIAEFIAHYEALGVSHFTFYTYAGVKQITNFLQDLKQNNYSIDILSWTLPKTLDSLHAQGQMASINDCIYRQMRSLTYSAVVDLDEYIIPKHSKDLHEVLKQFDVQGRNYGSFVYRSCLFCSEFPQFTSPETALPFRTQTGILRQKFIYPFLIRTKYIAKTWTIEMAGIHYVWKYIPGWRKLLVPSDQVLVHHYRSELCLSNKKTEEMGIEIDVSSRTYLIQLLSCRSIKIWRERYSNGSFN